ncbi:hypothetical protein [Ferruginibacter sp. HRS2-29]|uniref:hypothetical protein n=1 Tax=Ferruginibacter sp. HRS2-29 TaxID=2487334 RepID=UPI0020CF318F|nr:hypothetical protein [Ferruginibacter sp. HRS2-29]MCP9750204.1 hypothetical protein [Ferruginibacter sp. HRS2-29]MCP9752385.1 hypothetical protein [Ferruginibacter sp. HRS2-29]
MSINFYAAACQDLTNEILFGLCDDQNNTRAYIDTVDRNKWIAIVENESSIEITFTAIDNCITILRSNGDLDSRCDGMLTYTNNIIFVELKEIRTGGWISAGIDQLKHTISLYAANNILTDIRKRRAFLSNKKFPKFQYGHQEQMEQFKNEVNVRLIIHNTIKI